MDWFELQRDSSRALALALARGEVHLDTGLSQPRTLKDRAWRPSAATASENRLFALDAGVGRDKLAKP